MRLHGAIVEKAVTSILNAVRTRNLNLLNLFTAQEINKEKGRINDTCGKMETKGEGMDRVKITRLQFINFRY
jgi:hypothetical protein